MARAKVILVDADVISHFIATGHIFDLNKILSPHHLLVVDKVYKEASYHPWDDKRKDDIDEWLAKSNAEKINFPSANRNIVHEYFEMKHKDPKLGDGERACMAIAKYGGETIASSNFRDVAEYCEVNKIEYIGVLDILTIAKDKGYWTSEQCNQLINDAIATNQAKFPVARIEDYKSDKDLSSF